jgi:hypothetical protein
MARLILSGATVLDADGPRPRSTVVAEDRRIASVRGAGTAAVRSRPGPTTGWSSWPGGP